MPPKMTILEFLKEQSPSDGPLTNRSAQLEKRQHQVTSQLSERMVASEYLLRQERQFINRELRHLDARQDRQMRWILFLLVMQVVGFVLMVVLFKGVGS